LVSSITPLACRVLAAAIARACATFNTPPGNLIRQIPPSRAATMRSSPGHAEGRGVVAALDKAVIGEAGFKTDTGYSVARRPEQAASRTLLRHRYTPPDVGWHEQFGRQVSWLAGHDPSRPSRLNQWRAAQTDSLHTVAGAATSSLCSLFGPEGHRRLYYAFFRTAQRGWTL
jgi:hypothetical protein